MFGSASSSSWNADAIEPQRQHVPARADGGRAWPAVEELGLAEGVARLQDVERHLVAVVGPLEDTGPAADEHVESVGALALGREHAAERKRDRHEAPHHLRPGFLGQESEDGEIVEDARIGHGTPAAR